MPAAESGHGPDFEASIGHQLYLAHRYARAAANQALKVYGLDLRHLGVLGALAQHGPRSQRQLTEAGQLDKSSMVYVIDDLERAGLVSRQRDPNDRRAYAVRLTEQGGQRLAEAAATAQEALEALLAAFSAAERATLAELLGKFIAGARAGY